MKLAIIYFTSQGQKLASRLMDNFKIENIEVELISKNTVEKRVSDEVKRLFYEKDGLIFISSTGIAVRMIAPFIKSKIEDPAVVVVDDLGRYAISILSGHIGGANTLTKAVAEALDSEAIITTASDGRNIDAVDTFALRNNYIIDSLVDAKIVTSAMIEDFNIAIVSENIEDISYKKLMRVSIDGLEKLENSEIKAVILVSSYLNLKEKIKTYIDYDYRDNVVQLIPKDLYIGIGCRRNTSFEQLKLFVEEIFEKNDLDIRAIKAVGSIDIKEKEFGLIELSEYLNADFRIFSKEELLKYEDMFPGSEFVKKVVGVSSVSQTSVQKMCGNIIVDIEKRDGMTLTIGKEK